MLFGANVEPRHKIGRSFFLEIAIDTIQWKRTACEILARNISKIRLGLHNVLLLRRF